jgi:hypothetical protein
MDIRCRVRRVRDEHGRVLILSEYKYSQAATRTDGGARQLALLEV